MFDEPIFILRLARRRWIDFTGHEL